MRLLIIILAGIITAQVSAQTSDKVVKTENGNVYFSSGAIFETNVYEIGFIGQLKGAKKRDFLILTGRQCQGCDANISIYIHSPSDGPLKNEAHQTRYGFPGKEFYYENQKAIYEGKAFWGEVLPKRYGIIWFQKTLNDRDEWIESVAFAELISDQIETVKIKEKIEKTLAQVKSGLAWEIPGYERGSEP